MRNLPLLFPRQLEVFATVLDCRDVVVVALEFGPGSRPKSCGVGAPKCSGAAVNSPSEFGVVTNNKTELFAPMWLADGDIVLCEPPPHGSGREPVDCRAPAGAGWSTLHRPGHQPSDQGLGGRR